MSNGRPTAGCSRKSFGFLYLERKVLLRHIAEAHDDHGCQYLRDRRVNMKLLYEQLDEDDIEPDTNQDQHEITEQLDTAMQRTSRERNVPVQEKARRETETERDENGSHVGRDRRETQMHVVLVKDEIETEPVHYNVQRRTGAPAGRIPEGLNRHDPAERRIKEINKRYDPLFHLLSHPMNLRGVLIWPLSGQRY
jgi:hypothetical protein